ncbi:MAG: maltose ABC transporter permease MalF [Rhodocyclaceae bacterium]|nr:maltose ABC transporter permease MalF [Rhodocyclaceae bacterium]
MSAPRQSTAGLVFKWCLSVCLALILLYFVFRIYANGQPLWAIGALCLFGLGFYVYLANVAFAYRYLYPGVAAMLVFVALPMFYTASIGFTNYSSNNLLSESRSRQYLLEQSVPVDATSMRFTLHPDGNEFRIALSELEDVEPAIPTANFVSASLALMSQTPPLNVRMSSAKEASFPIGPPLPLSEVLKHRSALQAATLSLPDGRKLSYAGVGEFAEMSSLWRPNADGSLLHLLTGESYHPNQTTGFFENEKGEQIQPGFKVGVGLANYARILLDQEFRAPFVAIFTWTVAFSGLTVVFTLAIGLLLAAILNWEALPARGIYRTLLFLPYAVPAFISILVFKGLFNQNFGEINALLDAVFGVKPAWFADPLLAKIMVLVVNTWLGYPYFMILCSGLIKAIPADLYEASALVGASPWTNFKTITAPLIIKPLMPLLVSVFAFNFNNFVVIALLTDGRPDYLNTKLPAGTTDILVSYTYRIAFQDAGQNFGLAAAISTIIFILIALLSMANLRLTRGRETNQ